jgi:hypothetical protein
MISGTEVVKSYQCIYKLFVRIQSQYMVQASGGGSGEMLSVAPGSWL